MSVDKHDMASQSLEGEVAYFEQHRGDFLKIAAEKFVLVKGGKE